MNTRRTVTTNSTLADLPLETEYRSDTHDSVRDFYLPCLERSTLYRRAVGYFTSRGLAVAAQGITALIHGGGHLLPVASPLSAADDLEAILSTMTSAVVLRAGCTLTESLARLSKLRAGGARLQGLGAPFQIRRNRVACEVIAGCVAELFAPSDWELGMIAPTRVADITSPKFAGHETFTLRYG